MNRDPKPRKDSSRQPPQDLRSVHSGLKPFVAANPPRRPASDSSSGKSSARENEHSEAATPVGSEAEKSLAQATLFAARLSKRARHFRRWPSRQGITCYRLYDRDIPEIPLVVDRYGECLHITEYERPHGRGEGEHEAWLDRMSHTAGEVLGVAPENIFFKRRRRQRGKSQHEKRAQQRRRFEVTEGGLKFWVNLSDYVDTGLFLDHRITRQMVRDAAAGTSFLNLFCYTGSFTVYAAAGGAGKTVSVDLSRSYLDWARENMALNGFDGAQHQFVADDIREFLRNHRPAVTYDLVVVDPPTFSNSKRTEEDWNVQDGAVPLLSDILRLVRPGGVIYFSNNYRRFRFDPVPLGASEVREISKQTVPEDFRNRRVHRCWRIVK